MPSSTRIKGKGLVFKLEKAGTPTEFACDATSVVLLNEEGTGTEEDVVTFCDAAEGNTVSWFFDVEAITSTDATSFWSFVWDQSGDEVDFIFAPHGNATASTSQPHFTGSLNIGPKPQIGGTANTTFVFTKRFNVTGEPLKVTA